LEISLKKGKIGIIGLGYVGLPLAIEFGKIRPVVGFDINNERINDLKSNKDDTSQIEVQNFQDAKFLSFTNLSSNISDCQIYIITIPTPIDENKNPNLKPLLSASETVGRYLQKGNVVIYESTVYPGCTEDECVPVLEKFSGLKFNEDFFCGYSPERINPGDKNHQLTSITKVTSGSNPEIANAIDNLYKEIIVAGTYLAENIRIAEAAKVIENTQRDLNIALINELAQIFNKMDIDTEAVLKAAGSKWNFLPFRPGLVGGHCIGVDPYYLTHKSIEFGYKPQVILAGRNLNDNMGKYVASMLIKAMSEKLVILSKARVLIMGMTFKENCSDIRNSRVIDIVHHLNKYKIQVDIYDPKVNPTTSIKEYGISPVLSLKKRRYDGIILAIAHDEFKQLSIDQIRSLGKPKHLIYDLKYILKPGQADLKL
tara:strand:+ start:10175 stop:11455 length:1281 start_codon:yes stop_codon:yes gene_type:complete